MIHNLDAFRSDLEFIESDINQFAYFIEVTRLYVEKLINLVNSDRDYWRVRVGDNRALYIPRNSYYQDDIIPPVILEENIQIINREEDLKVYVAVGFDFIVNIWYKGLRDSVQALGMYPFIDRIYSQLQIRESFSVLKVGDHELFLTNLGFGLNLHIYELLILIKSLINLDSVSGTSNKDVEKLQEALTAYETFLKSDAHKLIVIDPNSLGLIIDVSTLTSLVSLFPNFPYKWILLLSSFPLQYESYLKYIRKINPDIKSTDVERYNKYVNIFSSARMQLLF